MAKLNLATLNGIFTLRICMCGRAIVESELESTTINLGGISVTSYGSCYCY